VTGDRALNAADAVVHGPVPPLAIAVQFQLVSTDQFVAVTESFFYKLSLWLSFVAVANPP
jgi:hypothetical protein